MYFNFNEIPDEQILAASLKAVGRIKEAGIKELSQEIVDSRSEFGMGEFILEQLGNRQQMESRRLDDFKRSST